MTNDERQLFASSVEHAFARLSGDAQHRLADAGLAEVGWRDALAEWGGAAIEIVLGEQGRACAVSSALDDVLSRVLGIPEPTPVLLPVLGSTRAPGTHDGDHLQVEGVAGPALANVGMVAVPAVGATGDHTAVVVPADALASSPVGGIAPEAALHTITAERIPASVWSDVRPVDWRSARAVAQVALAAELVGLGRGMVELAREHALSRVQFGRPIASFQAVRHRLVDAHLALEGAQAAVTACTDQIGADPVDLPLPLEHAAMAKALAGAAARTAARHCQQVLAGIGFTAEHRFHHYLRRTLLLDPVLGSAKRLTREVGELAVSGRSVPFDLPL